MMTELIKHGSETIASPFLLREQMKSVLNSNAYEKKKSLQKVHMGEVRTKTEKSITRL